ncbi:hypothetical protein OHU25_11340 [Streptomyces sp. NBC_00117]|uniref:hypothetical protein n=1 Tax=unclassified Streptomyces TaxID=2593676 RepID=UPI00324EF8C0
MELAVAEQRIAAFGKAMWEVGEVFRTIRERALHRRYGFTWEQYCEQAWGKPHRR